MFKKIIIRLGALLVIFFALDLIYNFTLFKRDLKQKSAEAFDIQNSQAETDIYYFGESSNVTYKEGDSIINSISELTGFFFPSLHITTINKYATHGGIYKRWLSQIDLRNNKPKAVILTLNLRSFGTSWINSGLETHLQESVVFTRPGPNLLNRFMLSLQVFDNRTELQRDEIIQNEWRTVPLRFSGPFKYRTVSEWDFGMSQGTYLDAQGNWDQKKIELACHYIKGYAFNIDESNERVRDFDEISEWCQKNSINLYLNLMAENMEYADSLVGKELVFLMTQNREFLVKRFNKNNCRVIDNLEAVSGKDFIDQNWTTEHYNYKGRMKIAKNLAQAIKEQFKSNFKEAY